MASVRRYPGFLRAMEALGEARVRAIGAAAGVAMPASHEVPTLAQALLAGVRTPGDRMRFLSEADIEPIGVALGLGTAAAWRPKESDEAIAAMPFYARPSYAKDVYAAMQAARPAERPVRRAARAPAPDAHEWPMLASASNWTRAPRGVREQVARELARALGGEASAEPLLGAPGLAAVRDRARGVTWVAIPGTTFDMGLGKTEATMLNKIARAAGPDAALHAKALAKSARPVRSVEVAPFLVARRPVAGDFAYGVGRFAAEDVAGVLAGARLPSEAEWELLARAGGARSFLGDGDPREHVARIASEGDLEADAHPWGVHGLAIGEWVDDGWHATYDDAPNDGQAWDPHVRPQVVRGGALALWPWQSGGEIVLCHCAAREHDPDGEHAIRLAMDLPAQTRTSMP